VFGRRCSLGLQRVLQLWWIQSFSGWWFISFATKDGTVSSLLLVRDRCALGVRVWFLWISGGVVELGVLGYCL